MGETGSEKPLRAGDFVMTEFVVDSAPSRVDRHSGTGRCEKVQPLELAQNEVHVLDVDLGPGVCGVRWSW